MITDGMGYLGNQGLEERFWGGLFSVTRSSKLMVCLVLSLLLFLLWMWSLIIGVGLLSM